MNRCSCPLQEQSGNGVSKGCPVFRAAFLSLPDRVAISRTLRIACLLTCLALSASGQEVYFFSEGTTASFYDQGIVDKGNLGGSYFEYTYPPAYPQYNDKIPCSTNAWKGSTSLKFNYVSSSSGNWKVSVFRKDWSAADISQTDSLVFHAYSAAGLPAAALPLIGIRTLRKSGSGEVNSGMYPLAGFNGELPAGKWTRVTFPLEAVRNDPANGELDLKAAKAVLFSQSEKDNSSRLVLIDEIMAFKSKAEVLPVTGLAGQGYDSHAELIWSRAGEPGGCRIYASFDGGATFEVRGETTDSHYLDFFPAAGRNRSVIYRVTGFYQEMESEPAEVTVTTRDFTDDELLDILQQYTFRYFWEGAHQESGMALERSNGSGVTAASGATGMGLMAMIAAHERAYRPQHEIRERILKILGFLEKCDRHHGAWSHWYNASTGLTQPFSTYDDGGDLVETSYVAQALAALRNYFTGSDTASEQIRQKSTLLLNSIEWDWYRQGGQNVLYWHWSPNYGFRMNMKITGWNECLITYVMAASSATHSIPREVYTQGWARNGAIKNKRTFYNQEISLSPDWGGPLFWIHYSHLGLHPKGLKDAYADYWKEHTATTRIHHAYAVANPGGWPNYGAGCWGLTASDDPSGYSAHQPVLNDNGTISPTAALSSIPYLPAEAMAALKYFYRERGRDLWGFHGPWDAFNDKVGWVKKAWLGIDQGPIMVMTENHRTGLLWRVFMKDQEVRAGLAKLGFEYDTLTTAPPAPRCGQVTIGPNPAGEKVSLHLPAAGYPLRVQVFDLLGKMVHHRMVAGPLAGYTVDCSGWPPGLYLVRVTGKQGEAHGRFIRTEGFHP